MAFATTPKQFHRTEIGGNAVVQQGDRQVNNTLHIATAYITLQDELDLRTLKLKAGTKRIRDDLPDHVESSCCCAVKRQKIGAAHVINQEQGQEIAGERVEEDDVEDLPTHFGDGITQVSNAVATVHHLSTETAGRSEKLYLLSLFQRLWTNVSAQCIPRSLLPRPTQRLDALPPEITTNEQHDGVLVARSPQARSMHELAVLFFALISCLAYRNIPGKDVTKIYARCQQDGMLPLLGTLLGFGVARYLYLGHISRALSGLSGDCIMLEDAFRVERAIPMSVCEDFSVLRAFLEVHYRGTTGEAFVKTGQFNLTLGSRRGLAIREQDWSTRGRIKPQHRVVMAVYLKTGDAKCTDCQTELIVSERGEFYCTPCNRYFRDCDALRYFAENVVRPMPQPRIQHEAVQQGSLSGRSDLQIPRTEEVDDEEDDQYALNGLQNIDLRIIPRRKRQTTRSQAQRRSLIDALKTMPFIFVSLVDSMRSSESIKSRLTQHLNGYSYRGLQNNAAGYFILFEPSENGQLEADRAFHEVGPSISSTFMANLKLHRVFFDAQSAKRQRSESLKQQRPIAITLPQASLSDSDLDGDHLDDVSRGSPHSNKSSPRTEVASNDWRPDMLVETHPGSEAESDDQAYHAANFNEDVREMGVFATSTEEAKQPQTISELSDVLRPANRTRSVPMESRPLRMGRTENLTQSLGTGMNWGGISTNDWIRDDMVTAETSPFSYQSPSHDSSYLLKLEANFMRDFVCCGSIWESLHSLLAHYEEAHAQQEPTQD